MTQKNIIIRFLNKSRHFGKETKLNCKLNINMQMIFVHE